MAPNIGLAYYYLNPWATVFKGVGKGSAAGRHFPETSDVIPKLLDPWKHVGSTTVVKEGEEFRGPGTHSSCKICQSLLHQNAIYRRQFALSTDDVIVLRMPVPALAENAAYHAHIHSVYYA